MANILYIPDLNPVRFYETNPVQFSQYLTKWFDTYVYTEQIYPWQQPAFYCQKFQTSDTITIQMESSFDPLQIDLIDRYGNERATLVGNLVLPNAYIPGLFVYEFTLSLATVPEGCYHLRLTNPMSDLNMVTEPISIKVKHPQTKLLQYRNTRFHGDVVFETGITFSLRVEANFDNFEPGADITVYENQKNDSTLLSARPYRVWPFVVGGSKGVPDWVVDKVYLAFCCNDVRIDGRAFARNTEDAKVQFASADDYPMRAFTMELREGINRQSKIVSPDVDTSKKLLVVYNINTRLFGDTSSNAGSNLVPITSAG